MTLLANDADKITGVSTYTFSLLRAMEELHDGPLALLTTWSPAAVARMGLTRTEVLHVPIGRSGMLTPIGYTLAANCHLSRKSGAVLLSTTPMGNFSCAVPQITVYHDLYRKIPGRYAWHQRMFFEFYARAVLRASRAVVAVSNATANDIRHWIPSVDEKLHVIGEGSQFAYEPSYNADRTNLLFVANIENNKCVSCLLDALRILETAGEAVEVRWVGRDRSGEFGGWIAANGSLRSIVPLGVIDSDALADEYRRAGALVVTSTAEGFCLPVIEAHGFGVPTILSDIPILREVGGDAAMYFPPRGSSELADAIRRFCADRRLRVALSEAAVRNSKRYEWSKAAAEMLSLVNTLR